MQLRSRKTLGRALGGTAILAATAFGAPALASAEEAEAPTGPDITTAVTEGKISVTVANPNTGPTSCGAFVVDALKLPALLQDPAKVGEPGFAAWQTEPTKRVVAEDKATFEVPLDDGIYAVIGECVTPGAAAPVTTTPQLAALGGPLGSVDLGLIDIGVLLDLVDQLPPQVVDVVADLAAGSVDAVPPTRPGQPAE